MIIASGDADVTIAKAAVKNSHLYSTTLIGEDTDLLVLLLYYANVDHNTIYFCSDTKGKTKSVLYQPSQTNIGQ